MNICFVCGEYPPAAHGGIGTITRLLARGLAAAGHRVRVIGVARPGCTEPSFAADGDVEVWRLTEPDMRGGWLLARRRLFKALEGWSRRREIDLVEVPDWQGWAAGWPTLNTPVVTRLHGSATYFAAEMGRSPSRITRILERSSLRRSDFWCSTSRYTADRTRALFALRSDAAAILPNPVDGPFDAADEPRSTSDVLFSGTLTAKKGVIPLIEAWLIVQERHAGAHLHLYGTDGVAPDGSSMTAYLESKLPAALRSTVTFHGCTERRTVLRALQRARVAVFPSFAEVCAMAPLEALSCGCPTISSARGSGPEQFEHGRHGLLVDPGDHQAIAAAIVRVLEDDAFARQIGEAGREHARRRHALAARIDDNTAFYRECIDRFAAQRHGRARVRIA